MDNLNPDNEKEPTTYKLYSTRAIAGATFLGGPLAAGYMVGENYKAINKPFIGRNVLVAGIIVTIVLFTGILLMSENILNKIPRQLIPIVYTAVILGLVEWKMGDLLKKHKSDNKPFYSGWRAAGIGLVSLIIITAGLFIGALIMPSVGVYAEYEAEMEQFFVNENETLSFYNHIETESINDLLYELDSNVIPKWHENINIVKRANTIDNLYPELIEQNKVLLKYAELRLEAFQLFRKAIEANSNAYEYQLTTIHLEIDRVLEELN